MEKMQWYRLLCTTRIRELLGGSTTNKVSNDARTEFERDYGRSVFSAPVRRLQDKAQVFPLDPHDAVRTRLTHSMEVSSVARDLSRTIARWMLAQKHLNDEIQVHSIEAIAATCGLIHDLGNPPFGHAGEEAIASWFKRKQAYEADFLDFSDNTSNYSSAQLAADFLKFEGNAQTIRIVSKLQVLTDMYGLNLTVGTLSAALKYVSPSNETNKIKKETKKPGFFASEQLLVDRLRGTTGTENARNPITYLVEASDDIVYSTVDIEDAIKKGVTDWKSFEGALISKVDKSILDPLLARVDRYIGDGSISQENTTISKDEVKSQVFRTFAITAMVQSVAAEYKTRHADIMTGNYHGALVEDCSANDLISACQDFALRNIYPSPQIIQREMTGKHVIHDLLDIFWEGANDFIDDGPGGGFPGKAYSLMSHNYRAVFEHNRKHDNFPERYCKLHLITDYVCGMTDTFATNLHKQLTNG